MGKTQTRKSISVRGVTYKRLQEHCASVPISLSDFVEQRIADYFGEQGVRSGHPPRLVAVAAATTPSSKPERASYLMPEELVTPPTVEEVGLPQVSRPTAHLPRRRRQQQAVSSGGPPIPAGGDDPARSGRAAHAARAAAPVRVMSDPWRLP